MYFFVIPLILSDGCILDAISTNSWSRNEPIPLGNFGYASAVIENKIFIMGAGVTQIYDPETDSWNSGTSTFEL